MGGGVELTVANLAKVLSRRGHQVAIVTPAGATPQALGLQPVDADIIQVQGSLQTAAQTQSRSAPVVTSEVLANAWAYARRHQSQYDLLVSFAYDWLPFFLTPLLSRPVTHFVSMGSLSDCLDRAIADVALQFPGTLGVYTQAQADTFCFSFPAEWEIVGCGLDIRKYDYCARPDNFLAWVGRISPEKGLEDAIAAATIARIPLNIFGKLEDIDYWQRLQPQIASANKAGVPIEYGGFLPTDQLQKRLRRSQALLVTPHWVEAFGIVAVEALACGVPVVAYKCGGPAEIVQAGKTGWLVAPGDVVELVNAIAKITQLDRADCRAQAEELYALSAWAERCEQWFYRIVDSQSKRRMHDRPYA